ncbi:response regulator transcription factor [Paenibacillus senegalensis]|uniref:response regulator transcription factor n=1 Tax=Paenibacillus senegalensis TaxID=1465766 RepID=UPI000289D0AB|nr:response regulator transcription factor [Paenibacillus senegalensis]
MYRIMICEDDPKLAALLSGHLEKYGYAAVLAQDFARVMETFQESDPHLVLLDVNLPKYDGFYWCRQIRLVSKCPILFISARDGEMDQVMALEYGADDYITKPFHYEVVMAKIRSQLRRVYGEYAPAEQERVIAQGGLVLYPERLELYWQGSRVLLTKREALLVELLLKRYPRVVSRESMLEKLWDESFVDENTLNVNITRVRKKLQELGLESALETIRGTGYRLVLAGESGERL